jgi:hypothetical protein
LKVAGVAEVERAVVEDRLPDPVAVLLQVPEMLVVAALRRQVRRPQEGLTHRLRRVVQGQLDLGHVVHVVGGVVMAAAEVDQAQTAVGHEEVVARMGIGIEQVIAVRESEARQGDLMTVTIAHRLVRVAGQKVVEVPPLHVLHREHALGGELIDDPRHHHLVGLVKGLARKTHVAGFLLVVHLEVEHAADVVELDHQVVPVAAEPHGRHDRLEVGQVVADGPGDVGILDLDRDGLAGFAEPRPVHLAQGGRGEGVGLEVLEERLGLASQLVAHELAEQGEVHGGGLEVQPSQDVGEFLGHHVGIVGQDLTDLHDRAPEIAHRPQESYRRLEVGLVEAAFPLIGAPVGAANPPREIRRGDLGLQRSQRPEAGEPAGGNRAVGEVEQQLAELLVGRRLALGIDGQRVNELGDGGGGGGCRGGGGGGGVRGWWRHGRAPINLCPASAPGRTG